MEWLAALVTLVGVWLGSRLTRSAGEQTWVREARLERYARLLLRIDKTQAAFDALLQGYASPQRAANAEEWNASNDELATAVNEAAQELRWTASEISLFASRSAARRTSEFLEALGGLLQAFAGGAEEPAATDQPAESPNTLETAPPSDSPSAATPTGVTDQWPSAEVLAAAQHFAAAQANADEALGVLRGAIVRALREDLAIDRASAWHRLESRVRRFRNRGEDARATETLAGALAPESGRTPPDDAAAERR